MRLGLLVALALAGCDPAVEPPVAAPPAVQAYAGGDTLRYRFDWAVEGGGGMQGVVPGDAEIEGGLHLSGELVLRVLGRRDDEIVLGATLVSLDTAEITVLGNNVLPGTTELVGREVVFTTAADGAPTAAYFSPDTSAILRRLIAGLLAQTDLRVLPRDAGPTRARVPATAGLAEVEYGWSGPDRWVRRLDGYARVDDGAARYGAGRVEGHLDAVVDEQGLATRLDGEEIVWMPAIGNEAGAFHTRTRFVLERTAVAHGTPGGVPDLDALDRVVLAEAPDDEEGERILAQRFAEGLGTSDVAHAVVDAGIGLEPERGFIIRATGMLRGWPERAAELEDLFAFAQDPRARSLLFDVLASGGTPEAQAVMCRLLSAPETFALEHRRVWLQRFSFVDEPTPELARFLLDEHDRVRTGSDAEVRRSVLYPMGTVARRLGATDPGLAEALHARLREELASATTPEDELSVLAGLGNQGAPEDEATVLARASSPDRGVRAQAASSLRLYRSTAAKHAVFALLGDREPSVAASALATLDAFQLDETGSIELAAFTLIGAYTPDLSGPLASALGRRRDDDPWVRAALLALRARTLEPTERSRIDRMLSE